MRRYMILVKHHDDEDDDEHKSRTRHHKRHIHDYDEEMKHDRVGHTVMAAVKERLELPPATWATYAGHPGEDMTIVDMEYQELIKARNTGTKVQVRKELTDLAAACAKALIEM